jgi:TRAP-type C4-dicarboxylate transport system substrate-binding protein
MNKDAFAKLPEPARAAIDKFSGDLWSKQMGAFANQEEEESIAKVMAEPGQQRYKITGAEEERWQKILQPITEEWLKETPGGDKVLAAYREELKRIRAGM